MGGLPTGEMRILPIDGPKLQDIQHPGKKRLTGGNLDKSVPVCLDEKARVWDRPPRQTSEIQRFLKHRSTIPIDGAMMNAHAASSPSREIAESKHAGDHPSGAAMFSDQTWLAIADRLRLSGQELKIVQGVFNGRKESAIAMDLGISAHTVHTHFERLHHKLDVADRVELVLRIMEEYLRLKGPLSAQ